MADILDKAKRSVSDAAESVKRGAKGLVDSAKQGKLGEKISSEVSNQIRKSVGYVDRNTPGSSYMPMQEYEKTMEGIRASSRSGKQVLSDLVDKGKRLASDAKEKILGSKREGGKIKKTGVYRLHEGEFVVKAEDVKRSEKRSKPSRRSRR